MFISQTYWNNFRNLKPRHLTWCSGLNLLTGRNGAGKTNMLEAINMACGWGSFYGASAKELRTWNNKSIGNINITCNASGEEQIQSEISVSSRISAKLNKERVSFSELRVHIPTLCFLPGDMNLIDGTPGIRRFFIDKLCTMLSIPYAKHLSDYKRLVRHRIRLLRVGKSPEITSHLMASIGTWIWSVRVKVVKMLDEYVSIEGSSTLYPFPLKIKLKLGGMAEYSEDNSDTQNITKDEFIEKLKSYSQRESSAKVPFVGPHRDDILILARNCTENNLSNSLPAEFLSRGQKRRAVLSIMLASGCILESKLKRKPIFLLDEIFSELDEEARQLVADSLFNTGWQIFAASAERNILNWQGEVYGVEDGERK